MNVETLIKRLADQDFNKDSRIRVWVKDQSEAIDICVKDIYFDDTTNMVIIDSVGRLDMHSETTCTLCKGT